MLRQLRSNSSKVKISSQNYALCSKQSWKQEQVLLFASNQDMCVTKQDDKFLGTTTSLLNPQ